MKKAVIATGGKQYLVAEGDELEVELLKTDTKSTTFAPIFVIDSDNILVGAPEVSTSKVTAEIVEENVKSNKVVAIRYKAKKRVHKVRGHRQQKSLIKISKIVIK